MSADMSIAQRATEIAYYVRTQAESWRLITQDLALGRKPNKCDAARHDNYAGVILHLENEQREALAAYAIENIPQG
jgi:hypothetical protein